VNGVDAIVFAMLAIADLLGLIYWRRFRAKKIRFEKMERSLRLAVAAQLTRG